MNFIDSDFLNYLQNLYTYEDGVLGEIQKEALENNIPIIPMDTVRFLKLILSLTNPKSILEIGCAVGFSASLMSEFLPLGGKLITIDRYEKMISQAKLNFEKQNLTDKITLLEGNANDILENLVSENKKFDLIFMDSAKGQYINILPFCLELLNVGGVLIADDIFQNGTISKPIAEIPRRQRTIHKRMNEFINEITNNDILLTSLLPIGGGIAICKKIKEI